MIEKNRRRPNVTVKSASANERAGQRGKESLLG